MKLIQYPEIRPRTGIKFTRQHIGRLVKAGQFPAPVRYGVRSIAWVEAELLDYLAKAANNRAGQQGDAA